MRALYIRQHGPLADLKIADVPVPALNRKDEVLVAVEAAGINPSDVVSVEGKFPNALLPRIVGRDFAGTVVEGPAEVVGTRVWGSGGDLGITRDGTHAEYIALPRHAAARRPENLKVEEAAAVGVPFITAFSAIVTLGEIKEGQWVIVSGAAGAVGGAAIKIAHAKGARVVALVRDARERERIRSARVEGIAQSDQGDLAAVVGDLTKGRGVDLALNGVGSSVFGAMIGALARGGRQVVYSTIGGGEGTVDLFAFYRNQFTLFGLNTQPLDATECAGILNELTPLFESDALKPSAIAEQYAFADAGKAYERVASRKSGKVVLVISSGKESTGGMATATRSEKE
ncbi:MAG TPA: zinc-binding alcohol dehydrogenase family protein [Terriglobales bacterium]